MELGRYPLGFTLKSTVHLSWFSIGKLTFNIHGQILRTFSGKELFTENSFIKAILHTYLNNTSKYRA